MDSFVITQIPSSFQSYLEQNNTGNKNAQIQFIDFEVFALTNTVIFTKAFLILGNQECIHGHQVS